MDACVYIGGLRSGHYWCERGQMQVPGERAVVEKESDDSAVSLFSKLIVAHVMPLQNIERFHSKGT
jgi:hypothetical protein